MDRSSTRVSHAPGGSSSLGFLFGGAPEAEAKVSSNRFASGAHQNSGNVITDRPTTRIHAAPGGHSSMGHLIGGEPAAAAAPARAPRAVAAAPAAAVAAPAAASAAPGARLDPAAMPVAGVGRRDGSNAYASGASQNSGNVLTDRPTTRVHAAPGGRSSMGSILSWS